MLKDFSVKNGRNTNLPACESTGSNSLEFLYGYDSIETGG